MKKSVEKALVLALIFCLGLVIVSAFAQDCECEAPNAVWLRPEFKTRWIPYTINVITLDVGVKLEINLNLPNDSLIYFAEDVGTEFMRWRDRTNLDSLPEDKFYIGPNTYNESYEKNSYVRCSRYGYWFELRFWPPSIDSNITSTHHFPIPLNKYKGRVLFVKLVNDRWLQFNLPEGSVITSEGYILAFLREVVICENRIAPIEANPD